MSKATRTVAYKTQTWLVSIKLRTTIHYKHPLTFNTYTDENEIIGLCKQHRIITYTCYWCKTLFYVHTANHNGITYWTNVISGVDQS